MIINIQERFFEIYRKLNRSQKLYLIGVPLTLNTLFWYLTPFNDLTFLSFILLSICLSCGIVSDILFIYSKIWKTIIGKSLLLVFYVFLTTLTYAFSDQIVNSIVAFESTNINRASSFVAIMLIPIVVMVVTFIVFLVFIFLVQFYIIFVLHFSKNKEFSENYAGWTCAGRVLIYPFIFGILLGVGKAYENKYENFVLSQTKAFIYNFEAKEFSRCIVPKGNKVISVSSEEIIVVSEVAGKYYFTPQICVPILKNSKQEE